MKKILVGILTYNESEYIKRCIESILLQKGVLYDLIIIDNDSKDDTEKIIKENFPKIRFIKNSKNVGAARGYNDILKESLKKDYSAAILMNADVILDDYCFKNLIQSFIKNMNAWVAFPVQMDYEGKEYDRSFRELMNIQKIDLKSIKEGGFIKTSLFFSPVIAIRRECIEEIGFFDTIFFLYHIEVDYSRRIMWAGREMYLCADSIVKHRSKIKSVKRFTDIALDFDSGSYVCRLLDKDKNIFKLSASILIDWSYNLFLGLKDTILKRNPDYFIFRLKIMAKMISKFPAILRRRADYSKKYPAKLN